MVFNQIWCGGLVGLDLVGDGGDNMWLDTVVVGVLAVGAHLVDIVGSG